MKFIENKEAVSPVVGVMLMLVVTLIIAGVVSAFGGGLVSTTSATPQASISCSLTYDDSLKIKHNGGDTIMGSALDVKAKIASGTFADVNSDVPLINATLPRGYEGNFTHLDGYGNRIYESFQTGDVITAKWDTFMNKDMSGNWQAQKGDIVIVSIFDKNSGKQIASQSVAVQ